MGVPASEVGYAAAMPRREDHEFHKDMWWHWGGKDPWRMNALFRPKRLYLLVQLHTIT